VYGHEWDPQRIIPNKNQAKVTKSRLKAKAMRLPGTLRIFFDDATMLTGYFLLDEKTGLLRNEFRKVAESQEFLCAFRNFCDVWLTASGKQRVVEDVLWGEAGREGSEKPHNFLTEELSLKQRIQLLADFVEALEFTDPKLARLHIEIRRPLRALAKRIAEMQASGRRMPIVYGFDETRVKLHVMDEMDEAVTAGQDRDWLRALDAKAGEKVYPFVQVGELAMAYTFYPAGFTFTTLVLRQVREGKPTSPRDVLRALRLELEEQLEVQLHGWIERGTISLRQLESVRRNARQSWDRRGSPARKERGPGWVGQIQKLLKAMVERGLACPTGNRFVPSPRAMEVMKRGGLIGLAFLG